MIESRSADKFRQRDTLRGGDTPQLGKFLLLESNRIYD